MTKVAVAGALEQDAPLDYWSKLILVLWDVPDVQKPYASIQDTIGQMNSDPEIRLIFADRELSDTESQVMASGWIEV